MKSKKIFLQGIVPPELTGSRLDLTLAKLFPNYSRSQLQSWIREGQVTLDTYPECSTRKKVRESQIIQINAEYILSERWEPQAIPLDVLYEDESLLIVNKPIGLVVHPGAGVPDQTLVNALLYYDPSLAAIPRAGIIHRLDKNTSGLLIIARTLEAHHLLVKAMKAREISREYEAVVKNVLISGKTIDAPIGRHPTYRTRMAVIKSGRQAITHFRIIHKYRAHTHIHLRLETGRTHQIRVHMAHIHHPLVGDPLYGTHIGIPHYLSDRLKSVLGAFNHQALHAVYLRFAHPINQKMIELSAPLPTDMVNLIKHLKEDETSYAK